MLKKYTHRGRQRKKIQETTVSQAASMDVAVAAVLSELESIFTLKEEKRLAQKASLN